MPELTLTIRGSVPSKKNSKRIFARGGRAIVLPSIRHEDWHKSAALQIKEAKVKPKTPIHQTKSVHMFFHHKDNRTRDLSNMAESVADLLVDLGILQDDSWQIIPELHLASAGVDKDNPHVDVKIVY